MVNVLKIKQRRWQCGYCGTCGWETGHERTSPRFDHDRSNGTRCLRSRVKPLTYVRARR